MAAKKCIACVICLLWLGVCLFTRAEAEPPHGTVINGKNYPPIMEPNAGLPVSVVPPQYPDRANERQLEGFVDFEFLLKPDGSVENPTVIQEQPAKVGFAQNAAKVFGGFKFSPLIADGKAVAVTAHYRFVFRRYR